MAIPVTVFSDYICPFCYIGYHRLAKLAEEFDLDLLWANIEIHPENPREGKPIEELGYPPEQWQQMMATLTEMADAEGLPIFERSFTTNSRRALLLAEAAKDVDDATFAYVHRRLFEAYLVERRNIGDPEVLLAIAEECGVPTRHVDNAWTDPAFAARLRRYYDAALKCGVAGTPTFIVNNDEALVGAVGTDELRGALARAAGQPASGQ
jgi:predicted DsbA family dithiol-disulfide isomerase